MTKSAFVAKVGMNEFLCMCCDVVSIEMFDK